MPAARVRQQSDVTIEELSESELSDTDTERSDSSESYEVLKRPNPSPARSLRSRSSDIDFQAEESGSESDNGSHSEASIASSSGSASDAEPSVEKAQRKGTRTLDAHPELYKVDKYPPRNAVSTSEYTLIIDFYDSHPVIGTSE